MAKYLITGYAATGKSTVGEHLKAMGNTVLDTDSLGHWVNITTGKKESYSRENGETALMQLRWVWDKDELFKLLDEADVQQPLFVCGYSDNLADFFSYFDKIFLLHIDKETLVNRLATRTTGDWGKDEVELRHVINSVSPIEETTLAAGAIKIDASLPITDVVRLILERINEN